MDNRRFRPSVAGVVALAPRAALCAAAWLSALGIATAQSSYRVVDVAPANSFSSTAFDIDPTGVYAAGWADVGSRACGLNFLCAFVSGAGPSTFIVGSGALMKQAYGVNATGQAVGVGVAKGFNVPYRWTGGTATPLECFDPNFAASSGPTDFAYSINASGAAVGKCYFYGQKVGNVVGIGKGDRAVLWSAGTASLTELPGGANAEARAINDAGEVVGTTQRYPDNGVEVIGDVPQGPPRCWPTRPADCPRATRWSNGTVTKFEPPAGYGESYAYDISPVGHIVGEVVGPGRQAGVLWAGGTTTVLGTNDARGGMVPLGINAAGHVVGKRGGSLGRGFLWKEGVEYDLTSLLDASGAGRVIRRANAISDDGKIAAEACTTSTGCVAVVLVPAPPAPPVPAYTRYLAEGATSDFFDTQIALLNPGLVPASGNIEYLRSEGGSITQVITVPARTRLTINPKMVPGLAKAEFSTVVQASQEVVVDRTMSWDATGYGSHSETAVKSPATTWYLAEGATIGGFSLFYLLQNPAANDTTVQVRYLRTAGVPLIKSYVLPARSRVNIWVNQEEFAGLGKALANAEVSAVIESQDNTPIIVERAMYRSNQGRVFNAGHESTGVSAPATDWFLAEGATGDFFDMFVLIANPTSVAADVTVTYLTVDGVTYSRNLVAPATSRSGIWVDQEQFPGVPGTPLANAAMSTTVRSTNGVPLVVERAMWWPGDSTTWHEAHNSAGSTVTGTRWAVAEGEVGGARAHETYLLIANTSTFAGSATVTLLFEDGTSQARTYALKPSSRTNVAVASDFGAAVTGRRFGAVIESTGTTPAQIVVERAMYSSAGGVAFAAGTNALATKLQ